ncbi:MAG TPA: methionyl-tRNA formyltransferase [Bacteroidales bacterium]|nr:methionyl-tRNA formyltransferase [Bacteroidales bacterium]HRZ49450.1 methionyl-tRNA formyltransferase [Bacteroidales bacterium]
MSHTAVNPCLKIVYMGTPEFSVPVLEGLVQSRHSVCGVVTVPDKPAGRGKKLRASAVKEAALKMGLPLAQPEILREKGFLELLRHWNPDLIVVVAFRMLPHEVYTLPRFGSINLHASLLPFYRGAAPIQRAIMNGEHTSGLTTFFLDHKTDTGAMIIQERMEIWADETAGELHDRMMVAGVPLVLKTVEAIADGTVSPVPQPPVSGQIPTAPKITRDDCRIRWEAPAFQIHNQIRGLSPYPGAFTLLTHPTHGSQVLKIFRSQLLPLTTSPQEFPAISTDGRTYLRFLLPDGVISVQEVQLQDRNRMITKDFLRGFAAGEGWKLQ